MSLLTPVYNNTKLLLPMNGANGATGFYDFSSWRRSLVAYGTAAMSTAQSKYYGSSGYFDGNSDYLFLDGEIEYNHMDLGTGDFTIAFWIYLLTTSQPSWGCVLATTNGSFSAGATALMLGSSRRVRLIGYSKTDRSAVSVIGAGQWYHVAFTRSGTSLKIFIDGAVDASLTDSQSWRFDYGGTYIGRNGWDGADGYVSVHIEDFLLIKGSALWTSAFTPPTKLTGLLSNDGSGVDPIKDDAGDPVARVVQAIPRGAQRAFITTSNGSGVYSMQAPMLEHNVVLLDDVDDYSDILIGSRVTPL